MRLETAYRVQRRVSLSIGERRWRFEKKKKKSYHVVVLINGIVISKMIPSEKKLETNFISDWGVLCGDGWSLFEAAVVCRQLGLGYASDAIQTNFFGGQRIPITLSGVQCHGDENSLIDCLHDKILECPGRREGIHLEGIIIKKEQRLR